MTAMPVPPSGVQPARSAREPFWDNVRFAAMALVVVGHSITRLSDSDLMAALYVAIYAFHMPLFAFVSGWFASASPGRPGAAAKLFTQLVAPYLVFSAIWFALRSVVEDGPRLDPATPYLHLWFLVALAVWRLVLPAVATLRFPVLTCVAVSVVSGYVHGIGGVFDSARIFGMLPFFVLGWAIKERGLPSWAAPRSWSSLPVRIAAAALLAGTFAVAYLQVDAVRKLRLRQWAQMNHNYADLGMPEWSAGFVRLGQLGLAVLLIAAVLVLVPRGRNRTSEWGQATMYVYMLHLFPLYLLWQTDFFFEWFDSVVGFGALIALAVGWNILLSTKPVRRLFRPLVEPRLDWLLTPAARSGRRARA